MQRPAQVALPRPLGGLRGAPRLHAGRRHPPHRLAALRAHRPLLPEGVRGRLQHEPRPCSSTSRARCASPATPVTKLDYGRYLVACLAYLARKQRDRVGLVTFDEDVIDFVPPSAKHLPILLHTLDRADRAAGRRRQGRARASAAQGGRGLPSPRPDGAGLGPLRGPRRGARRGGAARPPRQRPHGLPRPRPRRARVPVRRSRRPTRTSRAASASRWCRTRCASATARWWPSHIARSSPRARREPHRLRPVRHLASRSITRWPASSPGASAWLRVR